MSEKDLQIEVRLASIELRDVLQDILASYCTRLTDLSSYTPQFEEKIIHDVSVQSIGSKPKAVFGYN